MALRVSNITLDNYPEWAKKSKLLNYNNILTDTLTLHLENTFPHCDYITPRVEYINLKQ